MTHPLFMVFEGIDGSGKTTQADRLGRRLASLGLEVCRLVEPTHGPIGEEIRRRAREGPPLAPKEELDLFLRDRRENVRENLLPALARGEVVIQDRSFLSTVAYQGARPDLGLTPSELLELHRDLPWPRVVLLLDVSVERALDRIALRGVPDAFEQRAYLERVLEIFRDLGGAEAGLDVRLIDAARAPDLVEADVWAAVAPLVGSRPAR
jgi:dTMP kinase